MGRRSTQHNDAHTRGLGRQASTLAGTEGGAGRRPTHQRTHTALGVGGASAGHALYHQGHYCYKKLPLPGTPRGAALRPTPFQRHITCCPLPAPHHVLPLPAPGPATHASNHTTPNLARVENMVSVHCFANTPRKAPEGWHGHHLRVVMAPKGFHGARRWSWRPLEGCYGARRLP